MRSTPKNTITQVHWQPLTKLLEPSGKKQQTLGFGLMKNLLILLTISFV
ncbi:hypothetical protein L3081_21055 [Colwellia sp. MSW7]|uniref:Uncharacterized protein n=1 Tax=Colwellia maritima TaxID=2912588 RepID=A0ABS9X7F3_9GAMM|nr:hypothetical protein [Colwellia maritima]MCI2285416.1 hypothetical protein [Colwellia maritima]